MGDLAAPDLIIDHLDLGAFPAIHEVIGTVNRHYLAGWVPVKGGNSGIIAKYGDCKHGMIVFLRK